VGGVDITGEELVIANLLASFGYLEEAPIPGAGGIFGGLQALKTDLSLR